MSSIHCYVFRKIRPFLLYLCLLLASFIYLFIYLFVHSSAVLIPTRAFSSGDNRHDVATASVGSELILPGNTVGASSKGGGGDGQEVGWGVGSSSESELVYTNSDNATCYEPSGGGLDRTTQVGEKTTVSFSWTSLSFSSFIHHNNLLTMYSYQPPERTE